MQILQMTIIAILALAFTGLAVAMPLAIHRNYRAGKQFRKKLSSRLKRLPYNEMLAKRDINIDEFLAGTMVRDIRAQLSNCEECGELKKCGEALLQTGYRDGRADYSFCPNDIYFNDYENERANA